MISGTNSVISRRELIHWGLAGLGTRETILSGDLTSSHKKEETIKGRTCCASHPIDELWKQRFRVTMGRKTWGGGYLSGYLSMQNTLSQDLMSTQ